MKITTAIFCLALLAACGKNQPSPQPAPPDAPPADYNPEALLSALRIELPTPSSPVANYVNAVRTGNLLFLAGKGPSLPEGGYVTGRIGEDLTVEQGYEAARLTGIAQLAVLKAELGNLNRVKRIVKVTGMVNCPAGFAEQPEVVNGFSDLMVQVFGKRANMRGQLWGWPRCPATSPWRWKWSWRFLTDQQL